MAPFYGDRANVQEFTGTTDISSVTFVKIRFIYSYSTFLSEVVVAVLYDIFTEVSNRTQEMPINKNVALANPQTTASHTEIAHFRSISPAISFRCARSGIPLEQS